MRRALRQEEALRNRMKREHKRMQKRIDAVNETMTTAVHALMGKTAFKAGRAEGLFHGEKSAVEMSVVGALAHKWKSANPEKKKGKEGDGKAVQWYSSGASCCQGSIKRIL